MPHKTCLSTKQINELDSKLRHTNVDETNPNVVTHPRARMRAHSRLDAWCVSISLMSTDAKAAKLSTTDKHSSD